MTVRDNLLLVAAGISLGCAMPLRAAGAPAFEVTSVKPHKEGDNRRAMPQFLPGRFTAAGVPLKIVIAFAYNVGFQSPRLIGGPDVAGSGGAFHSGQWLFWRAEISWSMFTSSVG